MKSEIRGLVYVLGDDIDTDQIIPAEYLVYDLDDPEERKQYGRYALSSVPPAQAGLPRFRDTEVLARAANAVVPSGKTFRECVEAPPSTEHWPTPVHLYYEGNGRWLVETHLSEVQVVFNEATETFTPRNFAPPNPGCL